MNIPDHISESLDRIFWVSYPTVQNRGIQLHYLTMFRLNDNKVRKYRIKNVRKYLRYKLTPDCKNEREIYYDLDKDKK